MPPLNLAPKILQISVANPPLAKPRPPPPPMTHWKAPPPPAMTKSPSTALEVQNATNPRRQFLAYKAPSLPTPDDALESSLSLSLSLSLFLFLSRPPTTGT